MTIHAHTIPAVAVEVRVTTAGRRGDMVRTFKLALPPAQLAENHSYTQLLRIEAHLLSPHLREKVSTCWLTPFAFYQRTRWV